MFYHFFTSLILACFYVILSTYLLTCLLIYNMQIYNIYYCLLIHIQNQWPSPPSSHSCTWGSCHVACVPSLHTCRVLVSSCHLAWLHVFAPHSSRRVHAVCSLRCSSLGKSVAQLTPETVLVDYGLDFSLRHCFCVALNKNLALFENCTNQHASFLV